MYGYKYLERIQKKAQDIICLFSDYNSQKIIYPFKLRCIVRAFQQVHILFTSTCVKMENIFIIAKHTCYRFMYIEVYHIILSCQYKIYPQIEINSNIKSTSLLCPLVIDYHFKESINIMGLSFDGLDPTNRWRYNTY